jgi:hypothetical protein
VIDARRCRISTPLIYEPQAVCVPEGRDGNDTPTQASHEGILDGLSGRNVRPRDTLSLLAPNGMRREFCAWRGCVFRAKSATDSDMKSATDSDLISAIPI